MYLYLSEYVYFDKFAVVCICNIYLYVYSTSEKETFVFKPLTGSVL